MTAITLSANRCEDAPPGGALGADADCRIALAPAPALAVPSVSSTQDLVFVLLVLRLGLRQPVLSRLRRGSEGFILRAAADQHSDPTTEQHMAKRSSGPRSFRTQRVAFGAAESELYEVRTCTVLIVVFLFRSLWCMLYGEGLLGSQAHSISVLSA